MKYIMRMILFQSIALWVTSELLAGLSISGGLGGIVTAGVILALLTMFIKPILSILFLPLNFLTLGLANWLIGAVILYILTILVPDVSVSAWEFPVGAFVGFTSPSMRFSYPVSLILSALCITFLVKIFENVTD